MLPSIWESLGEAIGSNTIYTESLIHKALLEISRITKLKHTFDKIKHCFKRVFGIPL